MAGSTAEVRRIGHVQPKNQQPAGKGDTVDGRLLQILSYRLTSTKSSPTQETSHPIPSAKQPSKSHRIIPSPVSPVSRLPFSILPTQHVIPYRFPSAHPYPSISNHPTTPRTNHPSIHPIQPRLPTYHSRNTYISQTSHSSTRRC
ncbi:hypothetical protein ACMFMG_002316 [Clarireedia jacksonii]